MKIGTVIPLLPYLWHFSVTRTLNIKAFCLGRLMCLMTSQSFIVHLTSAVWEGVLTSEYARLDVTGCTEQKGPECCCEKCYRLYRTEGAWVLQWEMLQAVQNRRGLSVAVRNVTGCTEQKGPECCRKKCQLPGGKDTPEYYTMGEVVSKLFSKISLVSSDVTCKVTQISPL